MLERNRIHSKVQRDRWSLTEALGKQVEKRRTRIIDRIFCILKTDTWYSWNIDKSDAGSDTVDTVCRLYVKV